MNPPLRTAKDVKGIITGLKDGTIDAIATDHAPHSEEEKARPLAKAPSGMIGLETSLAIALTELYHTGRMKLPDLIRRMTYNPASILRSTPRAACLWAATRTSPSSTRRRSGPSTPPSLPPRPGTPPSPDGR